MTFDLEKILQSKREMRQHLAARPVVEKLAMLDILRERALALRSTTPDSTATSGVIQEQPAPYVKSSQ